MLCYLVDDLNDEEMHFDKFIKHANDFYSQTNTTEGIGRIFKLFDGNMTGEMSRDDVLRITQEYQIEMTDE